jgi:hypothetical protein
MIDFNAYLILQFIATFHCHVPKPSLCFTSCLILGSLQNNCLHWKLAESGVSRLKGQDLELCLILCHDLWFANPMLYQLSYEVKLVRVGDIRGARHG